MNKTQLKCFIPVILLLPFVLIGITSALVHGGFCMGWKLVDVVVVKFLRWAEK